MWYIYALRSLKDGHLYIGMSQNPEKRLKQHNAGMTSSTKSRKPFIIIYTKEYPDRAEARKQEKLLKTNTGRESLKNL